MPFIDISEELKARLENSADKNKIRSGRAPWAVRARMILEEVLDKEEYSGTLLNIAELIADADFSEEEEKK